MDPPQVASFDASQKIVMIASYGTILFIDLIKQYELDVSEKEKVSEMMNLVCNKNKFFVITNKKNDILGYYLFMINLEDPEADYEYLINWSNKSNIRNVDLAFLEEKDRDGTDGNRLAVSYKREGVNTYNVFVFDIRTRLIKFWFESYHLYE